MIDLNLLVLEGTISSKFYVQTGVNEKGVSAINFNLTNSPSEDREFKYACVAWRTDPDKFISEVREGDFVRITGHLQQVITPIGDNKVTYLAKVCADKVEILSPMGKDV